MAKKVTLKIQVPEQKAEELWIVYNKIAFEADPIDKKIMELILNKNFTAEEIRWQLRREGIFRTAERIMSMAKKIGMELKK